MSLSRLTMLALFAFASLSLQGVSGQLKCEDLPVDLCSFSVSSSGTRCVLEKSILNNDTTHYSCLTSEVTANEIFEWIEMEECIEACGVHRMAVGISSDSLLESHFTRRLCSPDCFESCPNIINLYNSLAAEEGLDLTRLCKAYRIGSRRIIREAFSFVKSSINPDLYEFDISPSPAPAPSQ